MIRDVLHSTQPADVMSAGESKRLCDTFVEYFTVRIRTIKSSIKSRLAGASRVYDELYADPMHTGETFSALQPPSVDEVTKLINAMPAKSSPVDKIPTSIIMGTTIVVPIYLFVGAKRGVVLPGFGS